MNVDQLIFVGLNGYAVALDRDTGEIVWSNNEMKSGYVTLLLDGDRLIVSTNGYIYCLDPLTGKIVWNNPMRGYGAGTPTSLLSCAAKARKRKSSNPPMPSQPPRGIRRRIIQIMRKEPRTKEADRLAPCDPLPSSAALFRSTEAAREVTAEFAKDLTATFAPAAVALRLAVGRRHDRSDGEVRGVFRVFPFHPQFKVYVRILAA
ncbi:MAG: PQQ-binding-like beta-propeller repeat protein [Gemmataceae bacterium]